MLQCIDPGLRSTVVSHAVRETAAAFCRAVRVSVPCMTVPAIGGLHVLNVTRYSSAKDDHHALLHSVEWSGQLARAKLPSLRNSLRGQIYGLLLQPMLLYTM